MVGVVGLPLTLFGLFLTFKQASLAKVSVEKIREEIEQFSLKKNRSEALGWISEARTSMENAAIFLDSENWREASMIYDDARKCIQKSRTVCVGLSKSSNKSLRIVVEHMAAFSTQVDNALCGKGPYPDRTAVRSAIRRFSDELTLVQREIHEGI